MTAYPLSGLAGVEVLLEDGERVVCRGWRDDPDNPRSAVLAVALAPEHPAPALVDRLTHEFGLKDQLDGRSAVRPRALVRENGRTVLLLDDPGGLPLDRQMGQPMELGAFLRVGVGLSVALRELHERGIIHKDIKPSHVLVDSATDQVWLTGFGIASRLPRERQAPAPPEVIAGTLAYMAPEQTGWMNRSIDARSDLYALGVTLYQMLTGALPFNVADPLELVHCHIARKPVPPRERLETLSAPVSQIIMKLLAKTAEERYQTAAGLERDLRRCLAEWELHGRIDPFALGEHDAPDRLMIPENLYGREREVATLLAAFARIVKSGAPELVLVSGYSGIGKSSVVQELHRALIPPRGLFAAGKFDQYKRDIPYSTLVQAFQSLVRSLLSKSEAELAGWRHALLEALGPNARLIVDLVPDLKLIVGDQPPVPELPPQQAQGRFQLVFRRFISVFARPEHPLALFLDDLQWLDAATLDLLEDLLTRSDVRHLMLIGAYRDNEVDSLHPLMRKLEAVKLAGARVGEIMLAPLACEHLGQLIADALRCEPERAQSLAQLVHAKTGGNPFFAIQFLHTLADEKLLAFDHDAACWSWDLRRIQAKRYTENVVDLMVAKLNRLPLAVQKAAQDLACFGNVATVETLSIVRGTPGESVHADLWEAMRSELVERLAGSYSFVHDRVQEAAYSLIAQQSRAEAHLRIGRLLAAHTPATKRDEAIFEIVNQLNRAVALITSREEREQLAEFNLIAGRRAKVSTAYASALKYLIAGAALLGADIWSRRRELMFAVELERAECEFLTGELAAADERLTSLSERTANTVERANLTILRMDVCTTRDQSDRAIAVALDYFRHVSIDWSPHPTEEEARREYEQIWSRLGSRSIEDLIELPLMNDPESLATVDVLSKVLPPALFTDVNLASLTICRAVNLSLSRGNCDASCFAYVMLGRVAGPRFGDYEAGFRFGQLGYDLVERRGLKRFQASTYHSFAIFVMRWMKHVRSCHDLLRGAIEASDRIGDLQYGAYARNNLNSDLLFAGGPLDEVQRETEHGLAFAQRARYGLVIDIMATQLALIRTLRALTPKFGCFDDEQFDEGRIERRFADNPGLALPECWYWIRKMQARYLAGDYAAARDAWSRAQPLLWTSASFFEEAEYHFFGALSLAACCDGASAAERQMYLVSIIAHHRQLGAWAKNCPENFGNRLALVSAEIARLEGRELDAERLYEEAICSARANDFIHNEALASELAARFQAARGLEIASHAYLRNARYCYLRWGADGKVRQLDEVCPQAGKEEPAPGPTSTIGTPVEHFDLATVIKVSQAVSSEIVLEKLLDTLMRMAIEQAGAERGLLVLSKSAEPRIAAEAATGGEGIVVQLRDEPVSAGLLPLTLLHYVLRTRESVIVSDATAETSFATDPYIVERQVRSILCLPLISQAKLVGALYLENNLAPGIFAPARTIVLKVLASQAAITLENARLYRDLAERESRIRRLVDANIVGIFIWDLEGRILEANDAFMRIVGYDREDLASGRVRWTELTPPEWLDRDTQLWIPELKMMGMLQPFEKEFFRKDGSRVPVLIGVASFEESGFEGVAFVLDLTGRKQAEAEARESERRYREVQMELAHANRVATIGQLTASITHEINHPIAATVANAGAGLRWLARQPPELEEARQAFARIAKDGQRAGNVVGRLRDLFKKTAPRMERLEVNGAIAEVIELTRGEAVKNRVSVETHFADGLPAVEADRTQLQQVILNLIINAVQALSDDGQAPRELSISTSVNGSDGVLVSIQDSGPGIPPENLNRLFEPFYTTKSAGMGMGLAICRSIMELHGGRLWTMANVPQGAVFHFTLRAAPQ